MRRLPPPPPPLPWLRLSQSPRPPRRPSTLYKKMTKWPRSGGNPRWWRRPESHHPRLLRPPRLLKRGPRAPVGLSWLPRRPLLQQGTGQNLPPLWFCRRLHPAKRSVLAARKAEERDVVRDGGARVGLGVVATCFNFVEECESMGSGRHMSSSGPGGPNRRPQNNKV